MKIKHGRFFEKNFNKRIRNNVSLCKKYKQRVLLFIDNPNNPILKNHKLTGVMGNLKSFSINGDIRVIYEELDNSSVLFVDIGSHNQVYNQ